MQNYAAMGVISVVWFMFGFSLCFGHTYSVYGSPTTFGMFKDVDGEPLAHQQTSDHEAMTVVGDIPGLVFAGYQGMFAVITPALMTGAFVDRITFGPYLIFIATWLVLVYCPFCHAIWGPDGWLGAWDVKDFAGGIVVHTTAGFSALAAVHYLGPRASILGREPDDTPHNIPFVALGTALLWFGWFGFNGGSALASSGGAAFAAVNTEIAASTALCVWTGIEWARNGKPSLVGMCVGAIAGLATITPAAGFVRPWAAFVIGLSAGVFCYACCELKNWRKWDDSLDVWGVHGMGGALGSVLLGILADEDVGGVPGSATFFGKQLVAVVTCAVYSYVVTLLILKLLDLCTRLKPTPGEMAHLDRAFHGEEAYGSEKEEAKMPIPQSPPSSPLSSPIDVENPLCGNAVKLVVLKDEVQQKQLPPKQTGVPPALPAANSILGIDGSPSLSPHMYPVGSNDSLQSLDSDNAGGIAGMTSVNSGTNLMGMGQHSD